jgi:hypothetical protein
MKFSERLWIDDRFRDYCEKCGVRYCVASFLAWLQVIPEGMKVAEKIRKESDDRNKHAAP